MPQYAYRAKRDVATEARGVIDAQDLDRAIYVLKAQGLVPLDVRPVAPVPLPSTLSSDIHAVPVPTHRVLNAAAIPL